MRGILFIITVYLFITDGDKLDFTLMPHSSILDGAFLTVVWVILVVGMLFRLIPNKRIATGARRFYAMLVDTRPPGSLKHLNKGVKSVAVAWIFLNAAVFFALGSCKK